MSYPMTQLGAKAFNHSASNNAEAEYERLRDLARQEAGKRSSCFDRSRQAYERGDGAGAHQLSEEGKQHAAKMDQYNKQASDYIFRENNAVGRVADDTIDLHGQFVEEAEQILEQRIRYAQQNGQTHLHVIVGKGNHSVNHVQKIKPRVEQICQQLGLQYSTEQNEGRMYINLQGGPATMPPYPQTGGGGQAYHGVQHGGQQHQQHGGYHGGQQQQGGYQQQQQGGYPGGPQQQQGGYQGGQQQQQQQQGGYQGGQQQQQGDDQIEQLVEKLLPKIIRKLEGCCVVM